MNANEVARLAAYVRQRYGCGICATPRLMDVDEGYYLLDIHVAGCAEHLWCRDFKRSAVEACIDGLWLMIFPDIV